MSLTRRNALALAAGAGALALTSSALGAQSGQTLLTGDSFSFPDADLIIHPVNHASLVLSLNGTIIYVDPVGSMSRYEGLPQADLILVTHEHSDHYERSALERLSNGITPLITNPTVFSKLSAGLKSSATSMANGDALSEQNIEIEAIPAYNLTSGRLQYHPPGRDNGYILNVGGMRLYLAGDTEDIPEMRGLKDIDIAFVPMILPWAMDVDQAASAVIEFAPDVVYPYHYGNSDVQKFRSAVEAGNTSIDVRLAKWY